jgi:predicted alpha/beta superfamily hydrolase
MLHRLNLLPLLIIPVLTTGFVLREGIVELPWSGEPKTAATLPPSEEFSIRSENTDATYRIDVQPPHHYNAEGDPYPVFYVLESRSTGEGYDEFITPLLRKKLIPDIIFVSITLPAPRGAGFARLMVPEDKRPHLHTWTDDLTFYPNPQDPDEGGRAEAFVAFLEEELFPEIDRRYHTNPDDRGIGAAGLGALFAVEMSYRQPGFFERAVAVAPRATYADHAIIDAIRAAPRNRTVTGQTRLYIGVGGDQHPAFIRGVELLSDALAQVSPDGVTYRAEILRGLTQASQVVPSAHAGLTFVYDN